MSILYLNQDGKIRAVDTAASGIVYKNADQIIVKSNGLSTHTHTHHLIMKSILILANTSFMVQSKPLTQIYAF